MDDFRGCVFGATPLRWHLCFVGSADNWWVNRLIPGRFKHVRAFGFAPADCIWIFYDVTLAGTVLQVARDKTELADRLIAAWTSDATVLVIEPRRASFAPAGWWCVPAMKHLVGVASGALLPDGLWRDCLRQGGRVLDEAESTDDADGSAARSAA